MHMRITSAIIHLTSYIEVKVNAFIDSKTCHQAMLMINMRP